jgi:hypothetical protein
MFLLKLEGRSNMADLDAIVQARGLAAAAGAAADKGPETEKALWRAVRDHVRGARPEEAATLDSFAKNSQALRSVVTQHADEPVMLHILVLALDVQHLDGQLLFFQFHSDQVTFRYCRYVQTIDEDGLRDIDALAGAIRARVGTPGPASGS